MRIMIKLVRFLFVCTVLLALLGGVFAGLTIWHFGRDLPDYQQLAHYEPPITTRVHASDGRLDRKSTRLNSSHIQKSRMPSSA